MEEAKSLDPIQDDDDDDGNTNVAIDPKIRVSSKPQIRWCICERRSISRYLENHAQEKGYDPFSELHGLWLHSKGPLLSLILSFSYKPTISSWLVTER